jgi:hypothetical protein
MGIVGCIVFSNLYSSKIPLFLLIVQAFDHPLC